MQGVNKAHELGYTGKGIKIGMYVEILAVSSRLCWSTDTAEPLAASIPVSVRSSVVSQAVPLLLMISTDYTHPALGGGFGPGFKVEKGYDLVGDDYFGTDPQPDSDPMDTCEGHGTHVAGIIAASSSNPFNVTGVAPDATIYAYRVFSCFGYTDLVILLEATERAFNDGADIITLSLGQNSPWSTEIFSALASNMAEQGRVLTIAAGNDGNGGPMLISSPGSGKEVIAVGSVQKYGYLWPCSTANSGLILHLPSSTRVLRQIMITNAKEEPVVRQSLESHPQLSD